MEANRGVPSLVPGSNAPMVRQHGPALGPDRARHALTATRKGRRRSGRPSCVCPCRLRGQGETAPGRATPRTSIKRPLLPTGRSVVPRLTAAATAHYGKVQIVAEYPRRGRVLAAKAGKRGAHKGSGRTGRAARQRPPACHSPSPNSDESELLCSESATLRTRPGEIRLCGLSKAVRDYT